MCNGRSLGTNFKEAVSDNPPLPGQIKTALCAFTNNYLDIDDVMV